MPEDTANENGNSTTENIEENTQELNRRIESLRELVKKEETLHVRNDDNFMLRYLRCSQYDPEAALKKMKTYYDLKKNNPQWFATETPFAPYEKTLSKHSNFILQDRDKSGKRIYVTRLGRIDPSKTSMSKESQLHDLFMETMLDEEDTQLNGISAIVDLKSYSWLLLRWLTPGNLCTAAKKLELQPVRKLQFHVVNTSALLNASLKLILPFLSAKTKENIHFHHENWPSLHKFIDPEVLPAEYGGKKQDINVDKLMETVYKGTERLTENLTLGYKK